MNRTPFVLGSPRFSGCAYASGGPAGAFSVDSAWPGGRMERTGETASRIFRSEPVKPLILSGWCVTPLLFALTSAQVGRTCKAETRFLPQAGPSHFPPCRTSLLTCFASRSAKIAPPQPSRAAAGNNTLPVRGGGSRNEGDRPPTQGGCL